MSNIDSLAPSSSSVCIRCTEWQVICPHLLHFAPALAPFKEPQAISFLNTFTVTFFFFKAIPGKKT